NPAAMPHVQGDSYRLIANLTGTSATVHTVGTPTIGQELSLFPDLDLAVLRINAGPNQPYAPITYEDVPIGTEVGVVGYPLARLMTSCHGNLLLAGVMY